MTGEAPPAAASLYVHWPFCESKCPYCDFNSHVAGEVDEAAWRRALVAELDHYADLTSYRRIETVFFGGGTPSLMSPATAGAVLDAAARRWSLAAGAEVTLEANPSSAEAAKFAGFRAAGINRVSVGAQSFDDAALRFLGRRHDATAARRAVAAAARAFERYSFDLIYALPGDRPEAWRRRLRQALALAGDHISLYQLTVEKGTPFFADRAKGRFALPDDDLAIRLLEIARDEASRAGYPAYEVSNHAAPGGACRHNVLCWRGGDYIGIGPGAHGRVSVDGGRRATEQKPAPAAWLAAALAAGHGTRRSDPVGPSARIEELLITGLRLVAGIDRDAFRRACGRGLEDCLDMAQVAALAREGLLRADERGLRASREGFHRLDAVIAALARGVAGDAAAEVSSSGSGTARARDR